MNEQNCITPIKSSFQKWKVATLDIETSSNDGISQLLAPFSMAATCLDGKRECVVFHHSILSIFDYIITKGPEYRWFVHNGANFDFRYFFTEELLSVLEFRGWQVEFIGSKPPKAFALRKKYRKILVCDSAKLITTSLKKGCESFGTQVSKGEIDFENGEVFEKDNPDHLEYLATDVVCLHQLVSMYRFNINDIFKVEPGCTAASTAFKAWRKTLTQPYFKHTRECSDFCRLSYYGGRTQVFFQGAISDIYSIDFNSLYPYIMRQVGGICNPVRSKRLSEKGFYHIHAHVPDRIKFGPLPYRKKNDTGIIFPVGDFHTWASSVEIIQALEMGCTVDILDGWVFEDGDERLFADFVNKCETFRNMDYNGGVGITCKIMQNSLYGFFGMRYEKEQLVFGPNHPDPDDEGWQFVVGDKGEVIENLFAKNYSEDSINCIPALAAWITANARVHLLKAMLACEENGSKVLMCDTDSIYADGPILGVPIGKAYGEAKIENEPKNCMIILAPKSYSVVDDLKTDLKCKGIPKKLLSVEDFVDALHVEYREDAIVKTFPQLNSLTRVLVTKSLGNPAAKRSLPIPKNVKSMVPMGIECWMKNVRLEE